MDGLRSIDPSECWVRHVVRGEEGEPDAVMVARVWFVREADEGLNGRQGWQAGETTAVLSEDGSFTLVLPNTAGDDGVLHRRRFRILTSDDYEPGEEWLEFWRDPNDLVYIGSPTDYEKTKSTVTIKGVDLPVVLAGAISSEVDAWDGTAPVDVLKHYTRVPVLAYGADLEIDQTGTAGKWGATPYTQELDGISTDCWTCEARLRWVSAQPAAAGASFVRLDVAGLSLQVDVFDGSTTLVGAPERNVTAKQQGLVVPGPVDLRFVARYDRIFAFVAGELTAEFRRPNEWPDVSSAEINAYGGTVAIDGLHVETLVDFAGHGPSAVMEKYLPGLPPPTGLRGRYWNAAPVYAQNTTRDGRLARLWPLAGESEPVVDRVDPQLDFPTGTSSYPPHLPGAYAARWTGAIFLDLESADRQLRLSGLVGNARVYVGRTLRGEEAASSWTSAPGTTPLATGSLREWLGESVAGWFPIVVEQAHEAAAAGIVLEDKATGGSYEPVPQSRLSPIGCYDDTVRLTPHRQVIGDVAQAFAYQWRVEYRPVESGEFPGQLTFRALAGRQTNVVIDDDAVGTEAQVTGSALDVVDGLLADAAGMADPEGSGQLTAQSVDYARASEHMMLRQGYESLSEISEAPLLQARIDSLLVLRSSPNEQVGVRPRGQRDLVDTFPLTGVLARMDWQPGDAPFLKLDSIDVQDETPRQLTSVTWPWRPDGIGAPTVGFRQRPRTPRAALKRLHAAIFGPRRTYQGSRATVPGTPGGATSAGAPAHSAPDGYSRVILPANLDDIVKATAVVQVLNGTGWRLEVSGIDLGPTEGAVTNVGRYSIKGALKQVALGAPYAYVRLIGGASGDYLLTIEMTVNV